MTTGSTVKGTKTGMVDGLASQGQTVTLVNGNPDGIITVNAGSQFAADYTIGSIYMGLAVGGSSWICLGSVAA